MEYYFIACRNQIFNGKRQMIAGLFGSIKKKQVTHNPYRSLNPQYLSCSAKRCSFRSASSNTNYLPTLKSRGVKYVPDIIISFAGDEPLATDMFKYIATSQVAKSHYMASDLSVDEIRVFLKDNDPNNLRRVKRIIELMINDYLLSHQLEAYRVTQLDNILTVGIPKEIDDISPLMMCEICGWRVNTEEELLIHRRTHWI